MPGYIARSWVHYTTSIEEYHNVHDIVQSKIKDTKTNPYQPHAHPNVATIVPINDT